MLTGPAVYGGPVAQWTPTEPGPVVTHETYIGAIRDTVLAWANGSIGDKARTELADVKVVYGLGLGQGARGLTYFGAWQNGHRHDVIEICAAGEESDLQLAGTTVHELGHALAGNQAGHSKVWREACAKLGLTAEAAGQDYRAEAFSPTLWTRLQAIPLPTDGKPVLRDGQLAPGAAVTAKPCPLGIGTKGGTSRGKGSGSRLRKWVCAMSTPECRPHRVASDNVNATCHHCGAAFTRAEKG